MLGFTIYGGIDWFCRSLIIVFFPPLGILAGRRPGSFVDQFIRAMDFSWQFDSYFWLGFLLGGVLSPGLKPLPVQGAGTGKHILLPSITLACSYLAMYTKCFANGIVEHSGGTYVLLCQARGLKRRTILWDRHPSQCFKSCSYFAWFKPWKYAFRSGNCGKCICLAGDGKGDCPCGGRQRLSGDSGLYL